MVLESSQRFLHLLYASGTSFNRTLVAGDLVLEPPLFSTDKLLSLEINVRPVEGSILGLVLKCS